MTIRNLLELIRFSHTIFALPFAFISAILAWTTVPRPRSGGREVALDILGILLCMVTARSFAMAINRLVDRDIDALNPRTASRHLPAGILSVSAVRILTVLTASGFVLSTTVFYFREPANPWPLILSVPVLLFLAGYSFTKRFTSLAHFWLGAALMLAPIAAWIAIHGLSQMWIPTILGGAVLFWVAGFDILYACQDAEFDTQQRLHSIPARLGIQKSLRLAALCHAVMFGFLIGLLFAADQLGVVFGVGLAAIGILLVYEHSIVRPDDLSRVNRAFFQVNAVISIGLLLLVLVQLAWN